MSPNSVPIRIVPILSPGNHESYLETDPSLRHLTPHASVLIGEERIVKGLKIWASPVTTIYRGAFSLSRSEDRATHYSQIPDDTDILITHGPPWGILDGRPGTPEHQGDPELLEAVRRIKPRLHIFGHVHSGYGLHVTDDTTFVNAALLGVDGAIANEPFVFDIRPA